MVFGQLAPMSFNSNSDSLQGMVGDSPAMREVYRLTRRAAKSNASVLLLGETGTGKELVAGSIHRLSKRASGPMVRVNCGALTETLLESELFGHVRGSFTDASKDRTGRFEAAHGGTIFLDEINSTSTTLQVKLLGVLQNREFERVGSSKSISVDVRVVAASNCDLQKEVLERRFREDLFWRLNVIPISLPPLRRRREDIEPLLKHFLNEFNRANEATLTKIHPKALESLQQYSWPGNVRELQNYVERAVVLAEGDELIPEQLPASVIGDIEDAQTAVFRPTDEAELIREFVYAGISKADPDAKDLYDRIVNPVEKELLAQVMEACSNTQTKAASRLGMNRNTLYKKLKEFGLDKSSDKSDRDA